tara:strand:- start:4566 stop:5417 length:852 start_codon:yes stop_codon:yes gene_type:complete
MKDTDVLVLGGSGTGKTHYAGQLLGRLRHDRSGRLRLRLGGIDDLSKLEEVLACLEEGQAAGHTPTETWTGIRCELETYDGTDIVLEWPEYAGERLFAIVDNRIMPDEWQESSRGASGWLLFIRPSTLKLYEDLLVRPSDVKPNHSNSPAATVDGAGWDDRARYVELLQMFLFAAGRSTFEPIDVPRLAVVFSCWDELNEEESTPEQLLAERLPLLNMFIRSTWREGSWSAWGLSSLGRALNNDAPDEDFRTHGPENFGYVLRPGTTTPDRDLTLPIAWLLGV